MRFTLLACILFLLANAHCHSHGGLHHHHGHSHSLKHRSLLGSVVEPIGRSCGTPHVGDDYLEKVQYAEAVANGTVVVTSRRAGKRRAKFPKVEGIRIPIKFHVIQFDGQNSMTDKASPTVSRKRVLAQWRVIDTDFHPVGIHFHKPTIDFHNNKAWTEDCYGNYADICQSIVTTPETTVNIIVCEMFGKDRILGMMPGSVVDDEWLATQAVFVDFRTLPNGDPAFIRFGQGRTATHELGHFFGLAHTFSEPSSCVDADGIADTPAQKNPSSGCPIDHDSCPDSPGTDASWSFMDYSDDGCMQRFSQGQINRIHSILGTYKPTMLIKAIASKGGVLPSPSNLSAPGIKRKAGGKKKSKPKPAQKKKKTKKKERSSKKDKGGKLRNGSESSKKKVKTG